MRTADTRQTAPLPTLAPPGYETVSELLLKLQEAIRRKQATAVTSQANSNPVGISVGTDEKETDST